MIKCSQCGGTEFEKGILYGWDRIKFRSVSKRRIKLLPIAYYCQNCGHFELFAFNNKYVKEKVKK